MFRQGQAIDCPDRCAGGVTLGADLRPGWGWGSLVALVPGTRPRGYGPVPLSGRREGDDYNR